MVDSSAHRPVNRVGYVLLAVVPDSDGTFVDAGLNLGVERAHAVGRGVIDHVNTQDDKLNWNFRLFEALRAATPSVFARIKSAGQQLPVAEAMPELRPAPTAQLPSVKYSPGMIIDFPKFTFALGTIEFSARYCVTVCLHESRSKIWGRFDCHSDLSTAPADWFKTMEPLTEAWMDASLATLIDLYEDVLRDVIKDEPRWRKLKLKPNRGFRISCHNSRSNDLETLSEALQRRDVHGFESTDAFKELVALMAASEALKGLSETVAKAVERYPERADSGLQLFTHATAVGSYGVFAMCDDQMTTIVGVADRDNETALVQVVSDVTATARLETPDAVPPSLQVTAHLSSRLAYPY